MYLQDSRIKVRKSGKGSDQARICHKDNSVVINAPIVFDCKAWGVWVVLGKHSQLDSRVMLQTFHLLFKSALLWHARGNKVRPGMKPATSTAVK